MSSNSISRRTLLAGAVGSLTAARSRAQRSATVPMPHFDVEAFVADVKQARAETDAQAAVEEVLRRAVSRPTDVLAALGEPSAPGIHTLHRDAEVTILNVVWAPLMVLLPHNHNMWASIGIYTGREDNILWQRQGEVVEAVGAAALSARQVFGLPANAIHSVTNPIGRLTGALHIYGGDFFAPGRSEWDPETLRERPWDLDAARQEFEKAGARYDAFPR